jgi:hypothetical protein
MNTYDKNYESKENIDSFKIERRVKIKDGLYTKAEHFHPPSSQS